jgi:hypothetical protein
MNADDLNAKGGGKRCGASAGVAEALIGLLTEQRELYVRLGALTDSQRSLITGDEPGRLLAVLGERQKLIDRLERLAERMRPYQQKWPELRSELAPAETERVDRLLAEVNELLAGILEKDKADAQLLAARKGAVGQAMAALKTDKQARAAYAAPAQAKQVGVDWTER